jgi:DNA-cytosine methyltransferase
MNVLSLFDGISCARVALDRAGLKVNTYYACEIEKNAIKVSQQNYPDIVRLGDVRQITHVAEPIHLLIGGSPCQDLSIAKKGRKGLEGDRSSLFYEYVRIRNLVKPTYFILENVASMSKTDKDIITREMGVEPVLFNASLVSAQSRKRLFWTNIPFDLPDDKNIKLKDILQPDGEVDERFVTKNKTFCLKTEIDTNRTLVKIGYLGETEHQAYRVYDESGKAPTLATSRNSFVKVGRDIGRRLNAEGHREDNNTDLPIQRRIELRTDEKVGTLTSVTKDNLIVNEFRIRKLTPIECERLQGLPDDYTKSISTTNRYKCLGNAFNVDVVAHILSSIHK